MSYLLSGLDLVVNNTTSITVNTSQTTIQGDIAPQDNVIAVNSTVTRFATPDNLAVALIKSTSTAASLINVTAKALNTTEVPISPTYFSNLNNTLKINYDGEYYVKLLLLNNNSSTIVDGSNNNYTIVIIQQEQEMGENKNRKRNVAEILSPGSNINITDKRSNYMMVIIYEIINNYVIAGISGIDLSTGKTFIYEVGSTKDDPELATDEVFRMISTYNPIELIILGDKIEEKEKKKILKNLNINNILVHYKWGDCKYIEFFKNIVGIPVNQHTAEVENNGCNIRHWS